ncbi:MAG: tetratricopeptide repeat protein [Aestuariivirgaceae bacterium]
MRPLSAYAADLVTRDRKLGVNHVDKTVQSPIHSGYACRKFNNGVVLMLKPVLMAVFLVLQPGLAAAGPYEDGQAAYESGDYPKALKLYTEAAEAGNVDAQLLLGFLNFSGDGVAQDYATALKWFLRAAAQGDARSQAQLGVMYENGKGVPQDYGTAATWFGKAADQGYGLAQNSLGLMYAIGQGVKRDYTQAHKWLNLAAAQEITDARENRDAVAKLMTSDQITEAQRMARDWLNKQSQ